MCRICGGKAIIFSEKCEEGDVSLVGDKAIETSFCEAVHGDAHDFCLF